MLKGAIVIMRTPTKSFDLYISGGMSGLPDLNRPAFAKAAKALRKKGYRCISPPELDKNEPQRSWEGCLRRDIKKEMNCKAIATLPGWTKSRGANLEIYIAKALKMPVKSVKYYMKYRRKKCPILRK